MLLNVYVACIGSAFLGILHACTRHAKCVLVFACMLHVYCVILVVFVANTIPCKRHANCVLYGSVPFVRILACSSVWMFLHALVSVGIFLCLLAFCMYVA